MYNLIPLFTLFIGFTGILFIVGRRLPDLAALEIEEKPLIPPWVKIRLRDAWNRLRERLNADKIQMFLLARLEKFLRRFRIVALKVDNGTFTWLKKIREKTVEAAPVYWTALGKNGQVDIAGEEAQKAVREAEDI